MLTVTFCKTPNETHLELLYSRRIFPLFLKKLCFRANYTLQLWAFALVSSSYANLVRSTHFGIQCVHAAEVRTMTKIWKYLFSYDSPQRDIETNGHILRFPHISKYLSFLFALFWSVDMPDIWFWVSGWVLILVTVTSNGLVIYFIMTKPRRQILLHRRPSFCFPSSLTITIRHLPCSWKYPEYSFSRFCPSLSLSPQLLISFALPGKSTARPGNWLLKSATTMLWTWVDRTSSHLQYSDCNTGVPPSWSYWWWPPSISRTSEGITTVSAFSPIYVPSLGRSDKWFIWCWLPTLLSIQFSIPSLRVIFKKNYLSCSQGR